MYYITEMHMKAMITGAEWKVAPIVQRTSFIYMILHQAPLRIMTHAM